MHARAKCVHRQQRYVPRGLSLERQRLHEQQLGSFERGVFLGSDDGSDDSSDLHQPRSQ